MKLSLLAATAGFGIATAHAGPVTFNASAGGVADVSDPQYFNFTAPPSGIGTAFVGDGGLETGSTDGTQGPPGFAAPYLSNNQGTVFAVSPANGPETTPFLSTGIGAATLSFATPQTYFGLLWGSVDAYNAIAFNSGATTLATFAGTDIQAHPFGDRGPNGTEWVNFHSTTAFDSIILASSQYAFEVGTGALQRPAAVREPGSLALLGAGLAMLGIYTARRRRLDLERSARG
jgi:hypothetical protein